VAVKPSFSTETCPSTAALTGFVHLGSQSEEPKTGFQYRNPDGPRSQPGKVAVPRFCFQYGKPSRRWVGAGRKTVTVRLQFFPCHSAGHAEKNCGTERVLPYWRIRPNVSIRRPLLHGNGSARSAQQCYQSSTARARVVHPTNAVTCNGATIRVRQLADPPQSQRGENRPYANLRKVVASRATSMLQLKQPQTQRQICRLKCSKAPGPTLLQLKQCLAAQTASIEAVS
jgi:hypothetical protein